jgi:Lysine-specific metallo-endopeptidase
MRYAARKRCQAPACSTPTRSPVAPNHTNQRSIGNQATLRLLRKSAHTPSSSTLESETPANVPEQFLGNPQPAIQRKCSCGGEAPEHEEEPASGRQNGVVHGKTGSPNRFTDCPIDWKPKANAAQQLGSGWLANVVNGLTHIPKPIPAPLATLLTTHFHTTDEKDIAKIAAKYTQLSTAINQAIDFQCETSCDTNVLAYVYSIWSDLHLCPYWFNSGAELQASVVIHELAHDVIGADDNAYDDPGDPKQAQKYAGLSAKAAMDNADSYAHFAWEASKP